MTLTKDDTRFIKQIIASCKPDEPLSFGDERYVGFDSILGDDDDPVRGRDLARRMAEHIDTADSSTTHLFAGFRGSGKSTELRRLQHMLQEKGYDVVLRQADTFFNRTLPVDIHGFLIALAAGLEEGVDELIPHQKRPGQPWFERVRSYFHSRNIDVKGLDVSAEVKPFKATFKGGLRHDPTFVEQLQEKMKGRSYEFHQQFQEHVEELFAWLKDNHHDRQGFVFIFDGIDHIRGSGEDKDRVQQSLLTLFSQYAEMLRIAGIHMIYTVPSYLPFLDSSLRGRYGMDCLRILPMTTQHHKEVARRPYEPGVEALKEFIRKRISDPERLLGSGCNRLIERMIAKSGGYLRDLLAMITGVALTAKVEDALPATERAVDDAIRELAQDYDRAVWAEDAEVLRQIAESFSIDGVSREFQPRLADLFETHVTMCYASGGEWYDVHPLILDRVTKQPS